MKNKTKQEIKPRVNNLEGNKKPKLRNQKTEKPLKKLMKSKASPLQKSR